MNKLIERKKFRTTSREEQSLPSGILNVLRAGSTMGFIKVAEDELNSHQYLQVSTNTKNNLTIIIENINFEYIPAEDR